MAAPLAPNRTHRPCTRRAAVTPILLIFLAIAAFALTFKPAIRANVFPKNFGIVEEGRIYRAGQMSPAAFKHIVEKYDIKTVVDFGTHKRDSRGERRNQRIADTLGLTRYRYDLIGDATGNPNAYAQTLRIITNPANHPVLIHCGAGAERTGCAVILYNHLTHGTSFEEGLAHAQNYKHRPERNPHLREVVETYGPLILESFRTGTPIPGVEPLPEPQPVPPVAAPLANNQ